MIRIIRLLRVLRGIEPRQSQETILRLFFTPLALLRLTNGHRYEMECHEPKHYVLSLMTDQGLIKWSGNLSMSKLNVNQIAKLWLLTGQPAHHDWQ